jgi:hypothetical protein
MGCHLYGVIEHARQGDFGVELPPFVPEPPPTFPVQRHLIDVLDGGFITTPIDTGNFDTQGVKLVGILWDVHACTSGVWTATVWDATTTGGTYAALNTANYAWQNADGGVVAHGFQVATGSNDKRTFLAVVTGTNRRFLRLRVVGTGGTYHLGFGAIGVYYL